MSESPDGWRPMRDAPRKTWIEARWKSGTVTEFLVETCSTNEISVMGDSPDGEEPELRFANRGGSIDNPTHWRPLACE